MKPAFRCLAALMLGALLFCSGPAGAAISSASRSLRARRTALTRAYNRRSGGAVVGFLSSRLVFVSRDGHRTGYQDYVEGLTDFLQSVRRYRQTLTIHSIRTRGIRGYVNCTTVDHFREGRKRVRVSRRLAERWRKVRGRWLMTRQRLL
jgi:hypothetical protein